MAMRGRPRGFDRDAALDAAVRVFWRTGFNAASMNDLCAAMALRSPSLYAAFGDKETLYREAVERYVQTMGPLMWGALYEGGSAREAVEAVLTAAAAILPESPAAPAGCMCQLGGVGDAWPPAAAAAVRAVRDEILQRLQRLFTTAIEEGELPQDLDAERWSRFYLAVVQGMAIQAKDGATIDQLAEVAQAAMVAWPLRA